MLELAGGQVYQIANEDNNSLVQVLYVRNDGIVLFMLHDLTNNKTSISALPSIYLVNIITECAEVKRIIGFGKSGQKIALSTYGYQGKKLGQGKNGRTTQQALYNAHNALERVFPGVDPLHYFIAADNLSTGVYTIL